MQPCLEPCGQYANEVSGTPVVKDVAGNDVTSQFKVKTVNGKLVIDKRAVTIKPKECYQGLRRQAP